MARVDLVGTPQFTVNPSQYPDLNTDINPQTCNVLENVIFQLVHINLLIGLGL